MAMNIAETITGLSERYRFPYVFKASYKKANRSRIDSFTGIGDEKALKVSQGPEQEYLLQFQNFRDASLFLQWLQDPGHRQTEALLFGNYQLLLGGEALFHGLPGISRLAVLPVH